MVKFTEEGHKYTSTDTANIKWTSVTTAIHHFGQEFDSDIVAKQVAAKKSSKWYGMSVSDIQTQWKATNTYSLQLGTWYHKMMEDSILSHDSIVTDDVEMKIVKPIMIDNEKHAPVQRLQNNTMYPEHLTYLKSVGIIGQSDLVEVVNGYLNIGDYKTNKEIKFQSFKKWDTGHQMMKPPFHHLQDCNYNHYCLQLSLYMYMILKHNPQLKPGKITLKHILFEIETRDKFDNPIYKIDPLGNFIVSDTQDYDVPYLKNECAVLVNWLKTNTPNKK